MARQACLRALSLAAIAAGLSLCATRMAGAEQASYCVTCKNPDQTYVCRVDAGGSRPSDALKLYCIIRTAKEGHHASCAAERDQPNCQGVEKVYSYDGPMPENIASDPRLKHFTNKLQRDQQTFADALSTTGMPDPDLLIRTSGEMRVSNFFLWQLAYTELYVTDTLWPDFREQAFVDALVHYQQRERRFGLTGEQQDRGRAGAAR